MASPESNKSDNDNLMVTRYYKTQPSDSLLKVSYLFSMSVPNLKKLNNLISDDLYPGQIIKLVLPPTS